MQEMEMEMDVCALDRLLGKLRQVAGEDLTDGTVTGVGRHADQ